MSVLAGWPRRRRDAGSGSVLAIGAVGVALCVTLGALDVARAVQTSHRARAAADLAALAAAQSVSSGSTPAQACTRAAAVSAGNSARVRSCAVLGACVDVVATAESSRPWTIEASGRARAGPMLVDGMSSGDATRC